MSSTLKILIVDDSASDAGLIIRAIEIAGHQVQWERVDSSAKLKLALGQQAWDLILCDYSMPEFSGIEALAIVRASNRDVPLIFVSGTMGEDTAVEAMRAGAQDYILKGKLKRLVPAIERELREAAVRRARQEAEAALYESEERFRMLVEQAPEGIFIQTQGRFAYVNGAMLRLLGATGPDQLLGKMVEGRVHPNSWDLVRERIRQFNEGCPPQPPADLVLLRLDGSRCDVNVCGVPFEFQGERGALVFVRDITERKRLEEQLLQSQKLEAVGQLAGGVAHDFNNILAAIMMQAEAVRMVDDAPAEVREASLGITAAAERAANLTRQLLLFGRKQVMQPRDLDLNEIVTSLAKMLQRIIGEDVQLQLNLHSSPLSARVDAGMIDQVLMNLAVNARDAMPHGGQIIIATGEKAVTEQEVGSNSDAAPGRYVCLRVTDTGCGIAPEIRSRIFEPFFTTKEAGKGTGLGLATVFGIVKQHRGWITVESQVGRGASFEVFLPAAARAAVIPQTAPAPPLQGGTETILVVEDDAAVRRLTRAILERRGYQVLEAANGVEALAIWEQNKAKIQLLFTDVVMPEGVSGRDLAANLQSRDPKLRVIFTSGYSPEIAGKGLSLQTGQAFLQKPASASQMLESVRGILDA